MAKNPKKKKQLVDKQIELIDKQIKAVPRILTDIQIQTLLLEREKLVLSKQDVREFEDQENSGVTPTMGLKALGAAAAFGNDAAVVGAFGLLAAGVGKKIFRGLFKKKNEEEEYQEEEILQGEVQKPRAPKRVRKPKAKISKPGFLMSAEDKIRAREERINSEKYISKGTPEKIETDGKSVSGDNSVIISILNKILGSFENDNERMRRSIRDTEEKKLESDPTPDTPGGPVKEGDDKKSGMNKLLMFGAIAGLLGLAYTFKDEIAKVLKPITDMLGITNPLKESDKEDYDFDIMDALGVTALMGMLGISAIPGKGVPPKTPGAPEKPNAGSNVRPRHPAGAKNAAGKSIGGQFMKVEKETITGIIKKSVGKVAGKIVPGLGLALGLYDAYSRAKEGDFVGAAVAAGGGGAALIPGIGTGVAIAAAAVNIARDVYKEAYGVFPEEDESGEKAKRSKDIMDEIIKEMTGIPYTPMTDAQKKTVDPFLQAYKDVASNPNPRMRQGAKSRLITAGLKAGIPRDALETELGEMRALAAGKLGGGESLAALQDSAAAAKIEASSASGGAPSSAGAGGATPAPEAAPSPSGMSSSLGSSGSPVASSPPPASETSGSAVTAATMGASEAQNSVTVLPPIVSNQSNTMKSGNEDASKAQKMTMQVRLNDDVFRKAVDSTAAVLKAA